MKKLLLFFIPMICSLAQQPPDPPKALYDMGIRLDGEGKLALFS